MVNIIKKEIVIEESLKLNIFSFFSLVIIIFFGIFSCNKISTASISGFWLKRFFRILLFKILLIDNNINPWDRYIVTIRWSHIREDIEEYNKRLWWLFVPYSSRQKKLVFLLVTYKMERMRGIEPPPQPWQGRILTIEPHSQIGGAYRIWTGDQGVADPRLTAWLKPRCNIDYNKHFFKYQQKLLLFLYFIIKKEKNYFFSL